MVVEPAENTDPKIPRAKSPLRRWVALTALNIAAVTGLVLWYVWPRFEPSLMAFLYCDEGQCHPLPQQLKEISLEMSPQRFDETFGTRHPCVQQAVRSRQGRTCFADSQMGAYPARCTADFGVQDRASRIACAIPHIAVDDFPAHTEVERAFLDALTRKYGQPDYRYGIDREFFSTRQVVHYHQSWVWRDANTKLMLCSEFSAFAEKRSRIEVMLVSSDHELLHGRVRETHHHQAQTGAGPRLRFRSQPPPLFDEL